MRAGDQKHIILLEWPYVHTWEAINMLQAESLIADITYDIKSRCYALHNVYCSLGLWSYAEHIILYTACTFSGLGGSLGTSTSSRLVIPRWAECHWLLYSLQRTISLSRAANLFHVMPHLCDIGASSIGCYSNGGDFVLTQHSRR